jgi:hypothetical protein
MTKLVSAIILVALAAALSATGAAAGARHSRASGKDGAEPGTGATELVEIRGVLAGGLTCMSPQEVHNRSASLKIAVTVTDKADAAVYGSSVTNKNFTLGPGESASLGCLVTSGMGMATIQHTFTIADASIAD